MAEPLTHRPFLELNAQKLVKVPNNVTRLHPAVIVRRPASSKAKAQSEPDRQHVVVPSVETTAQEGADTVAKKKSKDRAPRSSPEQREVAVARVTALVKAGETRDKAIERVAKELGYAAGSLNRWLVDSNAVRKKVGKKKRKYVKRTAEAVAHGPKPRVSARANGAANGSAQASAIGEALTMVVREIVATEVKRLLLQGVG